MSNSNSGGGLPLRALAMVLIALSIAFAGLGAMSLSSAESESGSAPATTGSPVRPGAAAQVPAVSPSAGAPAGAPRNTAGQGNTAGVDHAVPVRVLNNSLVPGLAAKTAGELTSAGWTSVSTGNYAGGQLAKTTVYYSSRSGDQAAASAIAAQLNATTAPHVPGLGENADRIVVVVTGR